MVPQKMHLKKVSFLAEKKWHVTPKNAYLLFYQIKPKICNLAAIVGPDIIYHTITHHMSCDDFAVHISVLLLKQNICWHHKANEPHDYAAWFVVSIS